MIDLMLEAWVSSSIEMARLRWMLGGGNTWRKGEKLKLLFAGYNGTRNTGSDVRVEEMIRQVRHVLGADRCELSVMSQNFGFTKGYFDGTRQVHLPDIFPPFLQREVPKHHGVVACEGSMFKSKFANALTTMMIGSLGIASAQNKLSVGYGAEAGHMDPLVAKMCGRFCRDSLVITRNEESRTLLRELGVPTELGTDTAWTFEPLPPDYGNEVLRKTGWDGVTPILVVCPINPFWWPVKASLGKYVARNVTGAYKESQYRTVYFHNAGPKVDAAYTRYLTSIGNAVDTFRKSNKVFVVMVATERLDADACHRISDQLGGVPVLTSDDYDMYQLVSILRACHMMVSSRFHGIVTSMAGLVPSAGITMDERIRNLMREWIRSTIPLKGVANIALEQHKVSSSLSPRRIKPKGNQHDVLPLERYGPLSPGRAADCWRRNFVGRIRHEHRHLTPRISPAQSDLPTPGNNSRIAVWI